MKDYYNQYIKFTKESDIKRRHDRIWTIRGSYYSAYTFYLGDPEIPKSPSKPTSKLSYDDLFANSNMITISYDIPGHPSPTSFSSINQMAESILSHLGLSLLPPLLSEKSSNTSEVETPPISYELLPFSRFDQTPNNISDLIKLGESYEALKARQQRFPLNIDILHKLVEPLRDLNSLIGMTKAKEAVFNQLIYQLAGLRNPKGDFLHTVIDGEPGVGKTELARILGRIFAAMGVLSKGTFTEVNITDLKGTYVGQTEMKTTKKLNEALGGVVYFDEAYSLGSSHIGGGSMAGMDSYSEGIINIINRYMSEHVNDLIMIFSGYRSDMAEKLFSGNRGLESRIGIWISIDKYEPADLASIFKKKVADQSWECLVDDTELIEFFRSNREIFRFNGRDIEIFLTQVKTAHARRMLISDVDQHRRINSQDLRQAISNWRNLRKQEPPTSSHIYI